MLKLKKERDVAQSNPILEIRNLHKNYGALEVLKGVDLTAGKSDVISIIGSSGSGKSTLLRSINLLEDSHKGDIIFNGEAVRWAEEKGQRRPADKDQILALRTQFSMVFQQFNLWAHMTILENVIEAPVTVLGHDRDEMIAKGKKLLDKVGIADKAGFFPAQLSGGQQQRAAIARALAMEPQVLLFDEPTSALDPELEQEVIKVIKDLAKEHRTMLLVTHDMALARDVSSKVIFLHEGRIEEEGRSADIFDNPKSSRLQQFLSASST